MDFFKQTSGFFGKPPTKAEWLRRFPIRPIFERMRPDLSDRPAEQELVDAVLRFASIPKADFKKPGMGDSVYVLFAEFLPRKRKLKSQDILPGLVLEIFRSELLDWLRQVKTTGRLDAPSTKKVNRTLRAATLDKTSTRLEFPNLRVILAYGTALLIKRSLRLSAKRTFLGAKIE